MDNKLLKDRKSGSILIIAMLVMLAISGISVTIYKLGKSNQRQSSSNISSSNVKNNAINAAQFAIDNLKLTPQNSFTAPPSCNSTATCKAAPQASGKIAFAWQQGTLASAFGSTPTLINDSQPLSFWQTYAYPVPGNTTDYVLVQINGGSSTTTGILYNITGYSNVNGNVATYSTTYYWLAAPCDCISITSQPAALPAGNLAANYGYWWNNNTAATQKAGGQINYNGGLLYVGLPETTTVTKAWIDPTGGACCDAYCRWDYQIPVSGRYVDIYFDNGTTGILNLYELQVYDNTGTNIALNKSAYSSSAWGNDTTNYGVQHLVDGVLGNLAHTLSEASPWMRVDLGSDQQISKIVLYNRTDCCGDRIDGAVLTVATSNNSEVFRYKFANGASTSIYTINPPTTNVQVSNVTGRYVFLYAYAPSTTSFNIKEIQVYDATNTNIASTATVYMSSVASGAANNVKDNNSATAVSTNDYKPWILLDFGANKTISKIVINSGGSLDRSKVGVIDGNTNSYVYTSASFFNSPAGIYTMIPQTTSTVASVSARYVRLDYFWKPNNNSISAREIQAYNGGSLWGASAGSSSQQIGSYVGYNNNYNQYKDYYCSPGPSGAWVTGSDGNNWSPTWNCNYYGWCGGGYWDPSNNWYLYNSCNLTYASPGKSGSAYAYTRQTQTYYYYVCGPDSNVVDNNNNTYNCTNSESYPYTQLDLGANKTITSVYVSKAYNIQNAEILLFDTSGTLLYMSSPFFFDQASYTVQTTLPSTTIPYAYVCTTMAGERAVSVTAGNTYPRCVGYGPRTGSNINGTLTVPSTYVP